MRLPISPGRLGSPVPLRDVIQTPLNLRQTVDQPVWPVDRLCTDVAHHRAWVRLGNPVGFLGYVSISATRIRVMNTSALCSLADPTPMISPRAREAFAEDPEILAAANKSSSNVVPERGLEPLRPCGHQPLKPARTVHAVVPNHVRPGKRPEIVHTVGPSTTQSMPLFSKLLAQCTARTLGQGTRVKPVTAQLIARKARRNHANPPAPSAGLRELQSACVEVRCSRRPELAGRARRGGTRRAVWWAGGCLQASARAVPGEVMRVVASRIARSP